MSFAFKKFNFFIQQDLDNSQHGFPPKATCSTQGGALLWVGCDNGSLQALSEGFKAAGSFAAHGVKMLEILWLESRRVLITVGLEEPGLGTATVKLWEADKVLAALAGAAPPQPLKTAKIFGSKTPESEVTAVAAKETASGGLTVAVGTASGMVLILHGDITGKGKVAQINRLTARPDQAGAELWGVTALHFQGDADLLSLFVVTESQTLSFNLQTSARTILDGQGAHAPHCCLVRNGLLVVARDDALYDYTLDTRAGCTVFEGRKRQLSILRRFLVVVTSETNEMGVSTSTVSVADVRNRMAAGTFTLQNVQHIVCAWGNIAVALGNGHLVVLKEVDFSAQLDTFFKRSLHKLALDVARALKVDAATLVSIRVRWGDHLYAKGDYDASMAQYLDTLGGLEPSYVIRRFLDAQRIHNLTQYLEALHDAGLASADHTTLLLNCYTKLKDIEKLDAFIQRDVSVDDDATAAVASSSGAAEGGGKAKGQGLSGRRAGSLKFDAETAVKVLRAAGYHLHALWVAEQAHESGWVLDILCDDMGRYAEALQFLETLPRRAAAAALKVYGKQLISHRPEDTTRHLMDLCLPPLPPGGIDGPSTSPQGADPDASYIAGVTDFAHLYQDKPTALMLLCEFILNSQQGHQQHLQQEHALLPPSSEGGGGCGGGPQGERLLYHTLLELYLAPRLADEPARDEDDDQNDNHHGSSADARDPHSRHHASAGGTAGGTAGAIRSSGGVVGSGALASSLAGATAGRRDEAAAVVVAPKQQVPRSKQFPTDLLPETRRAKALELLQRGWPPHLTSACYDVEHVLLLCRLHDFGPGLTFLYDKMRLYREVLQVYMTARDYAGLIRAVVKYGDVAKGGDLHLWSEVLDYFVDQPGDCTQQIVDVVDHIERGSILPPLLVLQTLARNASLRVSVVRGYVARQLQRETTATAIDRDAIARMSAETASMKVEVHKLKTQVRVFQNTRCSLTGQQLELPVVHFRCGHSFNLRSMGENDRECPLCANENRRVMEIKRNLLAGAVQQDKFFTELRENPDGFGVVAEHFGRGLMNATQGALQAQQTAMGL